MWKLQIHFSPLSGTASAPANGPCTGCQTGVDLSVEKWGKKWHGNPFRFSHPLSFTLFNKRAALSLVLPVNLMYLKCKECKECLLWTVRVAFRHLSPSPLGFWARTHLPRGRWAEVWGVRGWYVNVAFSLCPQTGCYHLLPWKITKWHLESISPWGSGMNIEDSGKNHFLPPCMM